MSVSASIPLAAEAKDGLAAGASVQILISGYPTWLAIIALWTHGELWRATLVDESNILIGKDSLIGVRFGDVASED
jgi:hypothetical protein